MTINFMNYKRKLLIVFSVSLLLGLIAKVYYFDKKHMNLRANKINFISISLQNAIGTLEPKKYFCDDFKKDNFIKTINQFKKDTLSEYHFLIGSLSFNFNLTESINAQIFSLGDEIYLKVGEVVFSGSIDLNSYFKNLNLIFGRYSSNDIKTIRLNIEKSEVSPYFMDGGIFEPKEGAIVQIIDHLKKSKLPPS